MPHPGSLPVQLEEIERAARTVAGSILPTPLLPAPRLPGLPDVPILLKLENLQRTGAFKLRGATNRIAQLTPEEARRGVIAASAGNHALGVAWAARARGVPATIVMAETASPLKVSLTRSLGARIVLRGTDYDEAHDYSVRLAEEEHLTYIHPYDDRFIIAGQGTVGLEILDAQPDVKRILVGVGGGGLFSGIAAAVRGRGSSADLVGVQPKGSDTLGPSLEHGRVVVGGRPKTFADGLATRQIGDLPFQILKAAGARSVTVDDRTIARASFLLLEQAKVLAEGAGATPLAALLEHPELADDGPIVLVISGGNIDPFLLDRVLFIGLAAEGRLLRLRAPLRDLPGRLEEFLHVAAAAGANVRQIFHGRESPDRPPGEVTVEVELEVRDAAHADAVEADYRARGWTVERVPLGPS
jgi:threonine dehydratase